MKFLIVDVNDIIAPEVLFIQQILSIEDEDYIYGQIKNYSRQQKHNVIVAALYNDDKIEYVALQDMENENPNLYDAIKQNNFDSLDYWGKVNDAVKSAVKNHLKPQSCSTKLGLYQKNSEMTCWFYAAVNGFLLGRFLKNLIVCMSNEEVDADNLLQDLQSSCPLSYNKSYLMKALVAANKATILQTSKGLHTSSVIKSAGLRHNPLWVSPGWYANKGIESILKGLNISYISIVDDILKEINSTPKPTLNIPPSSSSKVPSVLVFKPVGLTRYSDLFPIPTKVNAFGKEYQLDHGSCFMAGATLKGELFPTYHYLTAVYEDGCNPRMYDSILGFYLDIDWLNGDTNSAIKTLTKVHLNTITKFGLAYVLYVDIDSILSICKNFSGGKGHGKYSVESKTRKKREGGKKKESKKTKWITSNRKTTIKTENSTVVRTIYQNSKTGELRVRKMVTYKGKRKITYVKF